MSGPPELDQLAAEPAPSVLDEQATVHHPPINHGGLARQEPVPKAAVRKKPCLSLAGKPLSSKELEILRWAVQGKTVWEISRIRFVSPATVKFHLRNIYCKLQVCNRVQAVAEAVKRGLCK